MWPGMIPILQWPGEMMPGQLGPISRERRFCRNSQARTMSSVGIPSVMQTINSSSASAASMMASAAYGGGTKITEVSGAVRSTASCMVLKIGQPSCVVPPLPGVTPPTICVPYSAQALAWNVPSRPVRPCTIPRVDLFTRMLMGSFVAPLSSGPLARRGEGRMPALRSCCCDYLLSRILHRLSHNKIQSRLLQNLPPRLNIRTFQTQHDRKLNVSLPRPLDARRGQRIHSQDATKNIDQHRLHILVTEQDFERMRDLLGVGASAHIEKIGGHAAGV